MSFSKQGQNVAKSIQEEVRSSLGHDWEAQRKWPAEIPPMTREPAEKVVAEPDPPKKSRVFTLE